MPRPDIPRRDFVLGLPAAVLRLPVVATGLTGLSAASLSACAGTPWVPPAPRPGGLAVPVRAVDAEGGAFIQSPEMQRPIYVSRDASGAWSAVLASCTHRGCQPEPVGDRLVCPCHGSEFSVTGEVLQGPAERALTRYEVVEKDGELLIRTGGGS